jgi:excisionase family DNA binding protein
MEKLTFEQLPDAIALLLEKVNRIEQLLTGKGDDIQTIKEMLTTEEAAEFMGVSLSSIYKMTHRMDVPVYKPDGKKVYLKRSELVDYMSKNRLKSNDEIKQEAINYVTNKPLKGFRR